MCYLDISEACLEPGMGDIHRRVRKAKQSTRNPFCHPSNIFCERNLCLDPVSPSSVSTSSQQRHTIPSPHSPEYQKQNSRNPRQRSLSHPITPPQIAPIPILNIEIDILNRIKLRSRIISRTEMTVCLRESGPAFTDADEVFADDPGVRGAGVDHEIEGFTANVEGCIPCLALSMSINL